MALPDTDAAVGHSFGLELDGVTIRISEVSGLKLEQDVIELKEQTPDGRYVIRRLPGRPKPGEITLTRGLTADRTFADWIGQFRADDTHAARRDGAITVYDYEGAPVVTYTLVNAWPSKLEIGALKAGSSLVERLTLVYESVDLA